MSTRIALNLLMFLLATTYVTTDDLDLPSLSRSGLRDFEPQVQQQQLQSSDVFTSVSPNANSQTEYSENEQNNVNDRKDNSLTGNFREGGGLLELPLGSSSSNLTSQLPYSVTNSVSENTSTSIASSQEEEATEPSNKEISNSKGIMDTKKEQVKNSVTIDKEEGGQLGQNNESEISSRNSTLGDFHENDIPANYSPLSKQDKTLVQYLPNGPQFDTLHLTDLKENRSLEIFMKNETVDVPSKEIGSTTIGLIYSDLLQVESLNESSSNNQSYQVSGDNPKEQQQKEVPLELPKLPLIQDNPKEQQQKEQLLELPKLPLYLENSKEQQQIEQPLELPKLPLYQENPKEQQQKELPFELPNPPMYQDNPKEQEQNEQLLQLPKLPLIQNNLKEQQQQEQKEQSIELPKLPLNLNSSKNQLQQQGQLQQQQEQQQPLELLELPLYQYNPKEDLQQLQQKQQHQKQPLELPKPQQYDLKEEQQQYQQRQQLELPKLPLYQYVPKEEQQLQQQQQKQQQQQWPLELPTPPLYQDGLKEQQQQQQQQQLLELPKPPLYEHGLKEQQQQLENQQLQQQQPLDLPKLSYQYVPKEQQQQQQLQEQQQLQQQLQQQQPLDLPNLPLYQYVPKEQQQRQQQQVQQQLQQQQPLELLLKPLNQYGLKEQQLQQEQQQPLELPIKEQQLQQEQQQPLELPIKEQQLQQEQQQPIELPIKSLNQYGLQEQRLQQEQQQPLELPIKPLNQYGLKEQQLQQLPIKSLNQYGLKEQQLPIQSLNQYGLKEQQLPIQSLNQYGLKEQQLQQEQQQPLELSKSPIYQYSPKELQQQPLEQLKLQQQEYTPQAENSQSQENNYSQPVELSQLPRKITIRPIYTQKLPEYSQANSVNSNDEQDFTDYSKTGGSITSSDKNSKDSAEFNEDTISRPLYNKEVNSVENDLSKYEPPVSALNKQADAHHKQKTTWKSVYKVKNEDRDEGYQEKISDEGYYDADDEAEEFKNNNREAENRNTDDGNIDDGYVNHEDIDDEEEHGDYDKIHAVDDDDTAWDVDNNDDDDQDDFHRGKNHLVEDVEDIAKMNRPPTAPTSMVVFYTWMIVAVLIFVVGISMYRSRCHGFKLRLPGTKSSTSGSDRKRLLDHEFV